MWLLHGAKEAGQAASRWVVMGSLPPVMPAMPFMRIAWAACCL